jgi:hypothetical protein
MEAVQLRFGFALVKGAQEVTELTGPAREVQSANPTRASCFWKRGSERRLSIFRSALRSKCGDDDESNGVGWTGRFTQEELRNDNLRRFTR